MSEPVLAEEFPVAKEYTSKETGIDPEDIRKLRQWLKTQPHLPEEFITELDLVLCFHCVYRSAEVAKQVLDLNLTLKTLFNIFKGRVVDDRLMKTADCVLTLPLEQPSREGYAVFYARLIDTEVKKFVLLDAVRGVTGGDVYEIVSHFDENNNVIEIGSGSGSGSLQKAWLAHIKEPLCTLRPRHITLVFMVLDLWQYTAGTWPGVHVVIDLEGVQLAHITRLDISALQQFIYYLQEAVLVKLKGLHYLNAPSFMDKITMLTKPFMSKTLQDMIKIHQVGARTIDEYVPIETLPKEAGGQFKSLIQARDDIKARLKMNTEFFERENLKRVTESKRPGRPKTISDVFCGVEGSFKKLDID